MLTLKSICRCTNHLNLVSIFADCNAASQLLEDSVTCNKFKTAKTIKLVRVFFFYLLS